MTSMNKYNRLMEQVNPSQDMEQRLHAALDQPPVRKSNVRRYAAPAIAACLVLVLGGTALMHQSKTPTDQEGKPPVTAVGITEYGSTDELAAALPFPLALPEHLPEGYAFSSAANQFGVAVVIYEDAAGHSLKYCMGEGNDALEGISHSVSGTPLDGTDAAIYQDAGFTSVEWADEAYSYCFISDDNFAETEWAALVNSVQ